MPTPLLMPLFASLVGTAEATRAPVSMPSLCAEATAVVVAEVTTTEGRWQSGGLGGIETLVSVAVSRSVRGAAPPSFGFVVPGGSVNGITQTISEAPRFRTDARYLLFLAPAGAGWRLVGGVDGARPVPWGEGELERALADFGACGA